MASKDTQTLPKEFRKFVKVFSSLGILHSKINFLYTCVCLSLVPIGFRLKWTEQTGFGSHDRQNIEAFKQIRCCARSLSITTIFRKLV